jgi:hypothetical protein
MEVVIANIVIAVAAYFVFGGVELIAKFRDQPISIEDTEDSKWEPKQIMTLIAIIILVVAAVLAADFT